MKCIIKPDVGGIPPSNLRQEFKIQIENCDLSQIKETMPPPPPPPHSADYSAGSITIVLIKERNAPNKSLLDGDYAAC